MSLDGIQGTHFDPSQLSWKQQSESAWVKDALRKGEEEARLKAQAAAAPPPPPKPQVSFSDAAQAAFEQQLAARSAQKTAGTAETGVERYAKAQAEGVSLDEWERAGFSETGVTKLQEEIGKFGSSGGSVTATSKHGTVITVTSGTVEPGSADIRNTLKITRPDGLQLDLELDGDVRINDSEDGSLSVYFPSSGKTCVFDASGAMTVRQDEAGQSGTNGDDILINVKGSLVDGGDGDDTIINLADDAVINGGTGNDTIFAGRVKGNTITTGEGNDRLLGGILRDSRIDMGEGDNIISAGAVHGGSVRLGDGNNSIDVGGFRGSTHNSEDMKIILDNALDVRLGNGNNTVRVGNMSTYADLHIGDGDNIIRLNDLTENSSVRVGDGKNTYSGMNVSRESNVSLGNGGNTIGLTGSISMGGASVNSGSGDDTFDVAFISNGILDAGGGNGTIHVQHLWGNGIVRGGDGDDTIIVDQAFNASIHGGTGKNSIVVSKSFGSKVDGEEIADTRTSPSEQKQLRQAIQRYAMRTI